MVLSFRNQGESEENIREALGLHPFVVKKCLQQIQRLTQASLATRLILLAEADVQLKSGRLPERLQMERLILSLCERH
jgi:DNA polymerase-3 subunit delta